ncbi:MAG: HyaD/HybD family hydrogenase maturation endopeptidase [Pseudomonadota bacterium]
MKPEIMVLGVGNLLYSDDGLGIRVVEALEERYAFPDNVTVVDGGVLGINLLGVISHAHHLIVVDTILNRGKPGDLHRLAGDQIPSRVLAKNSLHQVDLLEALTLCQALDHVPETVIVGAEPQDLITLNPELTPILSARVDAVVGMVIKELSSLGAEVEKK